METGSGIAAGFLNPLAGVVFSLVDSLAMGLLGYREIGYDFDSVIKDLIGNSSGIIEFVAKQRGLKNFGKIGKWLGNAMTIIDIASYAYDWSVAHQYQIEEAVFNSFSHDVWVSNSIFDVGKKFEYAMNKMLLAMLANQVEVRKLSNKKSRDF